MLAVGVVINIALAVMQIAIGSGASFQGVGLSEGTQWTFNPFAQQPSLNGTFLPTDTVTSPGAVAVAVATANGVQPALRGADEASAGQNAGVLTAPSPSPPKVLNLADSMLAWAGENVKPGEGGAASETGGETDGETGGEAGGKAGGEAGGAGDFVGETAVAQTGGGAALMVPALDATGAEVEPGGKEESGDGEGGAGEADVSTPPLPDLPAATTETPPLPALPAATAEIGTDTSDVGLEAAPKSLPPTRAPTPTPTPKPTPAPTASPTLSPTPKPTRRVLRWPTFDMARLEHSDDAQGGGHGAGHGGTLSDLLKGDAGVGESDSGNRNWSGVDDTPPMSPKPNDNRCKRVPIITKEASHPKSPVNRVKATCEYPTSADDLLIGVWHSKGTEHRLRWLLDSWYNPDNVVFLGQYEESSACVPIVGSDADADDFLSTLTKGLVGLQKMFKEHPHKKWFIILGDDTYVSSSSYHSVSPVAPTSSTSSMSAPVPFSIGFLPSPHRSSPSRVWPG